MVLVERLNTESDSTARIVPLPPWFINQLIDTNKLTQSGSFRNMGHRLLRTLALLEFSAAVIYGSSSMIKGSFD